MLNLWKNWACMWLWRRQPYRRRLSNMTPSGTEQQHNLHTLNHPLAQASSALIRNGTIHTHARIYVFAFLLYGTLFYITLTNALSVICFVFIETISRYALIFKISIFVIIVFAFILPSRLMYFLPAICAMYYKWRRSADIEQVSGS